MRATGRRSVMVTGAGGFLGRHLCPMLAQQQRVIGVDLPGVAPTFAGEWYESSVSTDYGEMLDRAQASTLVHAAFRNRKPEGMLRTTYLREVFEANMPLLEACAERRVDVVLCGSSAVYGRDAGTLDERAELAPVSLYGLAKTLQEQLARTFSVDDLSICTARLFNLIGPGQAPGMLVPDWLSGLAAIAAGGDPVLRVRNCATSRDLVDVRDAVRALQSMVMDFRPGAVANIAGGEAVSLKELSLFLKTLCPVPFEIVETHPSPLAHDVAGQVGDASFARVTWGWEPTIGWRQSVRDAWLEARVSAD